MRACHVPGAARCAAPLMHFCNVEPPFDVTCATTCRRCLMTLYGHTCMKAGRQGLHAMDTMIFDHLARACASPISRRRALGAIVGMLALRSDLSRASANVTLQDHIALGGACTVSSECSQFQGCYDAGPITCAENGIAEDGPLNCCLGEGGLCGNNAHCCGSLLCLDTGGDGCGAGVCRTESETKPIDECGVSQA